MWHRSRRGQMHVESVLNFPQLLVFIQVIWCTRSLFCKINDSQGWKVECFNLDPSQVTVSDGGQWPLLKEIKDSRSKAHFIIWRIHIQELIHKHHPRERSGARNISIQRGKRSADPVVSLSYRGSPLLHTLPMQSQFFWPYGVALRHTSAHSQTDI